MMEVGTSGSRRSAEMLMAFGWFGRDEMVRRVSWTAGDEEGEKWIITTWWLLDMVV